jgi:hypothetical protein
LYILIFTLWIVNWKTRDSSLNDSKHSMISICFSFICEWKFYL